MKKLIKTAVSASFALAAAAVFFGGAANASAGYVPVFVSETISGNSSIFVYSLNFTSNGSTEALTSGDFITLYDVGSVSTTSLPASQTFTSQLLGVTAPFTSPPDSASVLNATLTYAGGSITADTTFTATLTFPGILATTTGYYSSTDTITIGKNAQVGRVTVPLVVVPEPATSALLALGGVVSVALLRRKAAKS